MSGAARRHSEGKCLLPAGDLLVLALWNTCAECFFYSDVNRNDPVVFAAAAPTRIINLYTTFISRWAFICKWVPFCLFSSSGTEQQFIDVIRIFFRKYHKVSWAWKHVLMLFLSPTSFHLCRSAGFSSFGSRKPRRQEQRESCQRRQRQQPGEQHGGLQQGNDQSVLLLWVDWFYTCRWTGLSNVVSVKVHHLHHVKWCVRLSCVTWFWASV